MQNKWRIITFLLMRNTLGLLLGFEEIPPSLLLQFEVIESKIKGSFQATVNRG